MEKEKAKKNKKRRRRPPVDIKTSEDLTLGKKRPPFKFVKVMDYGADNPIVNRLSIQFFDIIKSNILELSKSHVDSIKNNLFECMKDLLKVEEAKNSFVKEENIAIQKILKQQEENPQPFISNFDDPSLKLQKHFEDFLFRCVIAIRRIVNIAKICCPELSISGPKDFLKIFPDSTREKEMIENDSKWVKLLYDIRAIAEHGELKLTHFDANINAEGKLVFSLVSLPDKKVIVGEYIKVTLQNCFTFCEDMTAILLNTKCIKEVQIVQIPEEEMLKHRNFKYKLDLKGVCKEKFIEATNKKRAKELPPPEMGAPHRFINESKHPHRFME